MKRFSVALLGLAFALPAMAADNLSKGCDYYNKGQYDKALAYLQDVTSKKPRVWQGHYYLAHTYLAMGQRSLAMEEYQKCRACKPTPEVAAACDKIVGQLAANAIRHGGMPDDPRRFSSAHQDYINQQKQRLIEKTSVDSKRMLDETNNRIMSGQSVAADKAALGPYATAAQQQRAHEMLQPTGEKIKELNEETRDKLRQMK